MREALDEHRAMPYGDDRDQREGEQTQDLADRETPAGPLLLGARRPLLGESCRCHTARGFPCRANRALRALGQGVTGGTRIRAGGLADIRVGMFASMRAPVGFRRDRLDLKIG
ncbi:hypothetical protein SGFS_025160 [Streptomyces graminofaciens]|jgi:hypothetical protein|uniref:Uncharacterized protein n=1 Tax=Streptomyces graminofaciens TaxID=68212 RepID=A0ABM7F3Q2_9ACTN|nr:hypothetical protein SGFS_025160 [Streptomyces graminofaciens]